jgi:hypothetical protein
MNKITKLIFSLFFFLACSSSAEDSIIIDYKDFSNPKIWEPKIKEGKPSTKVHKDKELKVEVLRLRSFEASYYFQKSVNVDISKYNTFSWQWKVRRHPLNGDVRVGSRDDQAIQVLLAFEGRNLISYIWDSNAPVGYSKDSSIPFIVSQKILVVQSGDDKKTLNKWFTFNRDINADYKKLYGKNAPKLAGVAIQINSQHTESFCESYVSPLKFIAK